MKTIVHSQSFPITLSGIDSIESDNIDNTMVIPIM